MDALGYEFFVRALIAGLLAAVACGIVGSFVVVRRMASVSGGLSHAAFGGVGLGYLLHFDPLLGAGVFALASALAIGVLYQRQRHSLDTLISIFWSVGMALGVVFVSLAPGYAPDLMSYLFGSILFVSWEHVVATVVLDALVLSLTVTLFKELQAVAFEEEFTRVTGVPVGIVFAVLMAMVALTVVVLIRVVGVILVIALLTLPAATAKPWASTLPRMMAIAGVIGAGCTMAGLFGSFWLGAADLNVPTGPLIILAAAVVFGLSLALSAVRGRVGRSR
jgi:zinc transport system permease protein